MTNPVLPLTTSSGFPPASPRTTEKLQAMDFMMALDRPSSAQSGFVVNTPTRACLTWPAHVLLYGSVMTPSLVQMQPPPTATAAGTPRQAPLSGSDPTASPHVRG